jgi:hypothetical protein
MYIFIFLLSAFFLLSASAQPTGTGRMCAEEYYEGELGA